MAGWGGLPTFADPEPNGWVEPVPAIPIILGCRT